jgi:hypothetical protein
LITDHGSELGFAEPPVGIEPTTCPLREQRHQSNTLPNILVSDADPYAVVLSRPAWSAPVDTEIGHSPLPADLDSQRFHPAISWGLEDVDGLGDLPGASGARPDKPVPSTKDQVRTLNTYLSGKPKALATRRQCRDHERPGTRIG